MRKLVTLNEKKVITLFFQFRLSFYDSQMKLQLLCSKFSSLLGPSVLLIFEISQSVPHVQKSSGAQV